MYHSIIVDGVASPANGSLPHEEQCALHGGAVGAPVGRAEKGGQQDGANSSKGSIKANRKRRVAGDSTRERWQKKKDDVKLKEAKSPSGSLTLTEHPTRNETE